MTSTAWIPKRVGALYCSPACGGRCTHAAFKRATKTAAAVAKRLNVVFPAGKWRPFIYENLGWHWRVTDGAGRMNVHGHEHRTTTAFTAFYHPEPKSTGGRAEWTASGETAQEAVESALACARAEIEYLASAVGLTVIGTPTLSRSVMKKPKKAKV